MSEGSWIGYQPGMSQSDEQQPEIARPGTPDPGREADSLYRPGEGEAPDSVEEGTSIGAKVIGELRERRES